MRALALLPFLPLLVTIALSAQANDARDPTALPPALRSAMAAASAASGASEPDAPGSRIRPDVFAGGRAEVLQRGRR